MPVQVKKQHEWSNYQKNIFEDIRNGSGHTIVIARAGSGKTSTIVDGFKYVPKKLKTLMVAFNKAIADELRDRAPSYIDCFTLHSLGFRAIRNAFGSKVKLDTEKTFKIIKNFLALDKLKDTDKDDFESIMALRKIVSLCKGHLVDTPSKIDELMDKFDVDTCAYDREEFIKYTCQILRQCKENKYFIDFDDMIWFVIVYDLALTKYDRVFVDEAQDLNAAQIHMALSSVKKSGRIMAVGDDRQAIYGFRGADSDAIDNIKKKLCAKTLPLSVSYRCGKNIIKLAQETVPDIEHYDLAKDGSISYMSEMDLQNRAKPGDFVLSRTNAPLIKYCMAFLKAGIPSNIQGRDIGSNLAYLIKKSKKKTVPTFLEWLDKWKDSEVDRLLKKNRDATPIIDKHECLETLCEGAKSLDDVKSNIKELFNDGDDSTRVIFSTTHKAKGLERDRVFVLSWTYRKNQDKEESNLWYVAITRAKSELILVTKVKKINAS